MAVDRLQARNERRRIRAALMRIGAVVLVFLACLGTTVVLSPYLNRIIFVFFWIAIIFAAWYAGFAAALAAAALSVLAVNVLLIPPIGALSPISLGEVLTFALFIGVAAIISALAARAARASRDLKESEGHFRSIAEVAPVGIIMSTVDHQTTYVNPRALEIVGVAAHQLTERRWRSLMHPEDREAVLNASAPFMAGEVNEHTSEHRVLRPDGETRLVRAIQRWRMSATGERLGMVMILDDISREHMLESRLQQAQKLEAIGQLAGGIAHDFNNLLTVISGNLAFVRSELPENHTVQADLTEIDAAAERARLLVRQLLAFSRRQVLQPQPVDVGAALRQAERWFTRVLGDEIRVVLDVADRGHQLNVRVDPTQLDQVLINLAVNARDAMLSPANGRPPGGLLKLSADRLSLSARESVEWSLSPGSYVRIVVRDSGRGMPPETLAHAFEPFFTTKEVGQGTGLGLATVEGVIAQSGGAIRCESTVGVGTCFTILLPELRDADADEPVEDPMFTERRARPSGTVLLVEDEAGVRRMARRILERAGYTVIEATHGEEALATWNDNAADVVAVVTDLRMPQMGGFELANRLREHSPNLPVVFMSGFNEQVDSSLGDVDFLLEKPFTSDELMRAVRDVVWKSQRESASASHTEVP